MKKKKKYIFAHMSVKPWIGGGLTALADMSAKNISFFWTPYLDVSFAVFPYGTILLN